MGRSSAGLAVAGFGVCACAPPPDPIDEAVAMRSASAPAASATGQTSRPWRLVGAQGTMRFAVISGELANEDTYRDAMAALCGTATVCRVNFWSDSRMAPTQLPLSDQQAAAQVASWSRNLNTGHNELRIACRIRPGENCF